MLSALVVVSCWSVFVGQAPEESDLLTPKVKPAGADQLVAEDGRPYMLARWRLRTQGTEAALKDLDKLKTRLFVDRALMIRAEALEQRKNLDGAKQAYLDALEASLAPQVSEAAVRGLISVAAKQGDLKGELEYIDLLLAALELPRPMNSEHANAYVSNAPKETSLLMHRGELLLKLNRRDDARSQAWDLLESYPDPRAADNAEKLLVQIEKRKPNKQEKVRMALFRAQHWMHAARWSRALSALSEAKALVPSDQQAEVDIAIAHVYRLRKSRSQAETILERLADRTDLGAAWGEVLVELGSLAMDRYQYARARYLFQEVINEMPGTPIASTAAYLSAVSEYDSGNYKLAAKQMQAIEGGESTPELARNALWMAGWSAYLARTTSVAITNLERLRVSEPDPELRDGATYWLARAHERAEHWQAAIDAYREVAVRSPFRYYGLWSRAHLRTLHVPWKPAPRISDPPATIEEAIALLGKDRPINVDRAYALYKQGDVPEEVEELLAALEHYRRTRNRLGMTIIIDLFHIFDRDKWASLAARAIADESPEQPGAEPFFWRVWRWAYPTPYEPEVERAANDHAVDPFLTYAVMRTESRFRPDVVSAVGARGLMQLMPKTAHWIANVTPAARPEAAHYRAPSSNIWLGSWYLRNLVDRYNANAVNVLGAYNAGPQAMDRWIERFGDLQVDEFAERVPYTETRNYIRRTLESFMIYHALYDPPPKDEVANRDG
jgi:soluble lytic murein transglycosylase